MDKIGEYNRHDNVYLIQNHQVAITLLGSYTTYICIGSSTSTSRFHVDSCSLGCNWGENPLLSHVYRSRWALVFSFMASCNTVLTMPRLCLRPEGGPERRIMVIGPGYPEVHMCSSCIIYETEAKVCN